MEIVHRIFVTLTIERAEAGLHVNRTGDLERVRRILGEAGPLFAAKAVYTAAYMEEKFEGGVVIDGQRFQSRVLPKKSRLGRPCVSLRSDSGRGP